MFWLALVAVAAVFGGYALRVLHFTFAVDAAIIGGACPAVVAAIAFVAAAGRKPTHGR